MKRLLLLLPVLALTLVGCASPSTNFAEVVKSAGTANKEIEAEFTGWNAHFSYKSRPIFPTAAVTNSESLLITPSTTLKTQPVK